MFMNIINNEIVNAKMNKISVVLAVYNEEVNLSNCLNSVKDLAYEIVIVDGGSSDKTIDIAKGFGARIIQTNNPKNFHINKNKAIDEASGNWILQLDADEVVSKELAEEILKVTEVSEDINGYWIPRSNFFMNRFLKKGGQYPDYTLRLYRNGKGRLPAKDVHEQAEVSGRVAFLKHNLLHIRDKDFATYFDGFNRYTDFIAIQMAEKKITIGTVSFISYLIVKPTWWFLKAYIRHKGFMDGFAGFIFALFSSLRFPVSYLKYIKS